MATWEQKTLDKMGKLDWGRNDHSPQNDPILFDRGKIPYVEARDVEDTKLYVNAKKFYNELGLKQSRLFESATVAITVHMRADASIIKEASCLSQRIIGFTPAKKFIDSKFVKYCFNFSQIKKKLSQIASAGEHPILTLDRILKIPFPNPPFELQKKIGQIISTYDLLIENYQRQIEEARKQVVWKMIHSS